MRALQRNRELHAQGLGGAGQGDGGGVADVCLRRVDSAECQ
jgi:hypothetical protein